MRKKIIFILIAALAVFITCGCTKRQCVEADYPTFQPILDSPADGEIMSFDGPWTFDWHHDEPCEPFRYRVYIYDEDHKVIEGIGVSGEETELTVDPEMIFLYPGTGPYPGTEYFWNVLPQIEQDLPAKVSELKDDGQLSQTFSFFTDGICEPGELVPPVLLDPEDGSWAESTTNNETRVYVTWSYPTETCSPEGYEYQVAADPEFNHLIFTGDRKLNETIASIPVPTCTHLYWRVRSTVGESSSAWSDPFDFYYAADDDCWLLNSPGDTVLIKGYVFEDICTGTLPYESDSNQVLPPCTSSEYGIHGDGIWDNTTNKEPGIGGVLVTLGTYTCPEIGADEFETLSNGMYYFTPQAPGPICVSVNTNYNPQLENGIWTLPLSNQILTNKNFTLDMNTEELNQDFGWDENEFKTLNYTPELLTTCRQTDNKNSQAIMYLEEGAVIPVVATNPERTWFLTRYNCFVSTATGEAEEGDLPLYPEQPLPVVDEQGDSGGAAETGSDLKPCSSFTGPRSCPSPRCIWIYPIAGPERCTESD